MTTHQVGRMQKAALISLLLVSTTSKAQEQPCQPYLTELPRPRSVYFSKDPKDEVTELYVAGGVATTLRLPTAADPSRTKLLGWEGRFEPLLIGGKSVVIVPLQDFAPGDRFILLVALVDGTEIPFTVTSAKAMVDAQVNVTNEDPVKLWELQEARLSRLDRAARCLLARLGEYNPDK